MKYLRNKRGQSILCLILSVLLVWMLLPLGNLPQAQLRDPIGNDPLPPMDELQLGEGDQSIPETVPSAEPPESQPRESEPGENEAVLLKVSIRYWLSHIRPQADKGKTTPSPPGAFSTGRRCFFRSWLDKG